MRATRPTRPARADVPAAASFCAADRRVGSVAIFTERPAHRGRPARGGAR